MLPRSEHGEDRFLDPKKSHLRVVILLSVESSDYVTFDRKIKR